MKTTGYWVDDDGYIAYGKGDDYVTVAEIYPKHIQAITRIIEFHDNLLKACKAAFEYLPDPESPLELREKLYNVIYEIEKS